MAVAGPSSATAPKSNPAEEEPRGIAAAERHGQAAAEGVCMCTSCYGFAASRVFVCCLSVRVGVRPFGSKPVSRLQQEEREELSTDGWGADEWEVWKVVYTFAVFVAQNSTRGERERERERERE